MSVHYQLYYKVTGFLFSAEWETVEEARDAIKRYDLGDLTDYSIKRIETIVTEVDILI